MPVYCYKCKNCQKEFEIRHSMSYESQLCIFCQSDSVFKIPSLAKVKKHFKANRTGKVVDQYIEEVKQEIKNEKIKLKSEEL